MLRRRESVRQPTGQSRIGGSAQPRVHSSERLPASVCAVRLSVSASVCGVLFTLRTRFYPSQIHECVYRGNTNSVVYRTLLKGVFSEN